jgi:hypothetical protein
MSIDITSPFTGSTITGFTSPTYDYVEDHVPPGVAGEQVAVDTIGGTQANVNAHSVSSPFTITVTRPRTFKSLPTVNPVTGTLPNVPRNVYKVILRKGVNPLSGQPDVPMLCTGEFHVPAGADTADPENVKAAVCAFIGLLNDQSDGIADMTINGIL